MSEPSKAVHEGKDYFGHPMIALRSVSGGMVLHRWRVDEKGKQRQTYLYLSDEETKRLRDWLAATDIQQPAPPAER